MHKRLIIFLILPLLFLTSKVYAENNNQNQIYNRTNISTESPRQNNLLGGKPTKEFTMTKMDFKNNPKVQEFKAKIGQIKDMRKKQIVEKIDFNISTINTKTTAKMSDALTKMTDILNNVKAKEATIATGGASTAVLDTAISSALTSISTAQSAVTAQSQKQYTAPITDASSSAALKPPMAQMLGQFRTDILATFKTVLAAKTAVKNAIVELNKLTGDNKIATNGATLR